VFEHYLSEIKKGNNTPQITFDVLRNLLEQKHIDFKGKFNQKYTSELAKATAETNEKITKNDESLIRKVLFEILETSNTIGGNKEHKTKLRQSIIEEISQWLHHKDMKDRHLKRVKTLATEHFYNLLKPLCSIDNQPLRQDIIETRAYTKRNTSEVSRKKQKPSKTKLKQGRPGRDTEYYHARQIICKIGGISGKLSNKKEYRAIKSKFNQIVQVAASSKEILDHVKSLQSITTITVNGSTIEQNDRMKYMIKMVENQLATFKDTITLSSESNLHNNTEPTCSLNSNTLTTSNVQYNNSFMHRFENLARVNGLSTTPFISDIVDTNTYELYSDKVDSNANGQTNYLLNRRSFNTFGMQKSDGQNGTTFNMLSSSGSYEDLRGESFSGYGTEGFDTGGGYGDTSNNILNNASSWEGSNGLPFRHYDNSDDQLSIGTWDEVDGNNGEREDNEEDGNNGEREDNEEDGNSGEREDID